MMRDCLTIEELKEEQTLLGQRMTGLQVKLNGLAGEGANATRDDVLATRQEFLEVRAEQFLRMFQIAECEAEGEVLAGSLQRACDRMQTDI